MQVKEPLLVKDVLYACLGVNGKFTAFQQVWMRANLGNPVVNVPHFSSSYQADDINGRFVINPQADVPPADRELMNGLMELGFLFRCGKSV